MRCGRGRLGFLHLLGVLEIELVNEVGSSFHTHPREARLEEEIERIGLNL